MKWKTMSRFRGLESLPVEFPGGGESQGCKN
jgi:hypothetical protein